MPNKVYLSGGIKDFSNEERYVWREKSKALLTCETIDPTRDSYNGDANKIVISDKNDIDDSTHLLVYFIRPSVGTSMEVLYAWSSGKRIYLVNETKADLSPWLLYHSHKVFNTLEEAIAQINEDT